MEVTPSAGDKLLLVDNSAWARGFGEAPPEYEPCLCDVTRLEILYSARSPEDYLAIESDLDEFRTLTSNAETWATARTAHRELAAIGQHRVSLPDLLVAACAQQHGADVLNVDRHFEVLERVLSFRSVKYEPAP